MSDEFEFSPAFMHWIQEHSGGDVLIAATWLREMIPDAPQSSEVWNLLEQTGDETYTNETFLKAARFVLEWKD
jgi:hypothetical protein